MRVSLKTLQKLLQNNVVEVKFNRRDPKPGDSPTRRMLCTNSGDLLYSVEGKMALNFVGTAKGPTYNPRKKNLIVTWDIFMQNYRTITMDTCQLISVIPADQTFWNYFTENLAEMTARQKQTFMDT